MDIVVFPSSRPITLQLMGVLGVYGFTNILLQRRIIPFSS